MTRQKRLRRRLDYDNVKYSIFFFSKNSCKINSYANEVSVGSQSDKRHQPITICSTTQCQKFDSLARKQSTNGFLKQNNAQPLSEY